MRARTAALVVAVHGALAVALTWPVALHWRTRLPIGAEPAGTVPFFNLWTLRWDAHAFGGFGAHLGEFWDAPIFHPLRGAFARSEAQPLTGFAFAIVRAIVGDVGAYNTLIVGFVALNGIAGYVLARRLHAGVGPAVGLGALAQGLPFVWTQFGVLQLVCVFPMILAVERLLAYRESGRWHAAAGFALACAATALMSGYYAVFLGLTLLVLLPGLGLGRAGVPGRRRLGHALGVVAIVAVCAGPFALSQQSRTAGARWTVATVTDLSAHPGQWIERDPGVLRVPWSRASTFGDPLFPGGVLLGLAATGVVVAFARQRGRRVVVATGCAAAAAALVSGGFRWRLGSWRPYSLLYDHLPGFDRLRSPFRFGVSTQLLLLVPAAVALAWLWERRGRAGKIAVALLVVAALLETVPFGAATTRVPDTARTDWVRFLGAHRGGAVAMVPFAAGPTEADFEDTAVAMLAALDDGHPLVNGYTGFFPPSAVDLVGAMKVFPDTYSVARLHDAGTRYVVVTHAWLATSAHRDGLAAWGFHRAFTGRDRDVFRSPA